MASPIIMVSENKFTLSSRGNDFTLEKLQNGQWGVTVINASVRAYCNGFAMPKEFDSLVDVEKAYKSWRGISLLVAELEVAL